MSRRLLLIPAALQLVTGWAAPAYCQPVDSVLTQGRTWCNSFDEFCDHPNTGRPYLFNDGCLDADVWHSQIGGPYQNYDPRIAQSAWSPPAGLWDVSIITNWGPEYAPLLSSVAVTLYHRPTPEDPETGRIVGRWVADGDTLAAVEYPNHLIRCTAQDDGNEYPGAVEFWNAYGFGPADAALRIHSALLYTTTPPVTIDGLHHGARITLSVYIHRAGTVTDIDENGVVDAADLFAFLALWFAYDPAANWDGINDVDTADIFAFMAEWEEERE